MSHAIRQKFYSYIKEEFLRKMCLVPTQWHKNCSEIYQAHTIPKSSLKCISFEGHVYSLKTDLFKLKKNQGQIPERIGINKASTFLGFCSRHDNEIFSPLEKHPFSGTKEQCFLLGYRALAFMLYRHMAEDRVAQRLNHERRLQNLDSHNVHSMFLNNLYIHKIIYDEILISRCFDSVEGYVVELDVPPPVMCSAATFPDQDFGGIQLQDCNALYTTPFDLISFTAFATGGQGIVAFVWTTDSNNACSSFIESLKVIPDECVTAALLRLFFEDTDNIHISPKWWKELPEDIRQSIIARMQIESLHPNALVDDGIVFDPWPISRRYPI